MKKGRPRDAPSSVSESGTQLVGFDRARPRPLALAVVPPPPLRAPRLAFPPPVSLMPLLPPRPPPVVEPPLRPRDVVVELVPPNELPPPVLSPPKLPPVSPERMFSVH